MNQPNESTNNMNHTAVDRRTFIRGVGAALSTGGTVGLAGCGEETHEETITPPARELPQFDSTHGGMFSEIEPVERAVYKEINEYRAEHDHDPFGHDEGLSRISRFHSRNMAVEGFYDHTDHKGRTPGDRAEMFGYSTPSIGEILVRFTVRDGNVSKEQIARHAVEGWDSSTSHRYLLLAVTKVEIGVGIYITEQGEFYITAMASDTDVEVSN